MNQENPSHEEQHKGNVEALNMDGAIEELQNMIQEASEIFFQLKKVKFDYLVQTCELFSRIDYPSIMMEVSRKEVLDNVPKAKSINKMDF